ncbi:TPA: hypothetical protein HA344_09045 [Candidatus Bathyarchaeota archaeon]|nr:hypothetical protein [Candidatus Bathyarchaeota archaeon]
MAAQPKTIWDRLEDIPREILYGLLLITIILPMIYPIGFPVPISAEVQRWYNTIDALPAGSVVMIDFGYSGGGEPELAPMAVAVYHHLFKKGDIKVVTMSTSIEGPLLWEKAMLELNPAQYGKQYGVDYIHIGYIANVEAAMAAVGKSISATTTTDYKGTPLSQYSIMEGVDNAADFALLICYTTGGDQSEGWVRQWYTTYQTPYLSCVLAMMVPTMLPYQKAGQIVSVTSGAQAGQMELLVEVPGRGIKSADVITMTHLLCIAFVVVGNIAYFGKKFSGGKK